MSTATDMIDNIGYLLGIYYNIVYIDYYSVWKLVVIKLNAKNIAPEKAPVFHLLTLCRQ